MTQTHHTLFAANYNPDAMQVYNDLRVWLAERNVAFVLRECTSEAEVIQQAQPATIYLAYKFPVTRNIITQLPRLQLLLSSGSGYDHIDVTAATEHGIIVANAATHNVEDVAEHTIALIVSCARKFGALDHAVRQGQWRPPAQPIYRFRGQTLGLVGFGRIARTVAGMAKGLGLRVIAHGLHGSNDRMLADGVEPVGLDTLLRQSDFVSLHARLTPETRHLLGERELRAIKPTAYLINTSRGALVDEAVLVRALTERRFAGAGLDVLESEPPRKDHPLFVLENVIVTGHSAASTVEAPLDWQKEWRLVLEAFISGNPVINVANPEVKPKIFPGQPPARVS